MLGLFRNRRAKLAAATIHQLCQAAQHANATFGPGGATRFLSKHPFLTSHRKPRSSNDPHELLFRGDLEPFQILVYDEEGMVQVLGGSNYAGITITMTKTGGYFVLVSKSLRNQSRRNAKALAGIFVTDYGAHDTSEFISDGIY